MKKIKLISLTMAAVLLISTSGCSSIKNTVANMSNTAKGGIIGGTSGTAFGAILGRIVGGKKGAWIGGVAGAAVGTTAGVLIGKKMDKAAAQAKQISGATVDTMTVNGTKMVKVTLDSNITFSTGKYNLSNACEQSLANFAQKLDPQVDLAVYGHTDNTGSLAINQALSLNRANAVANYLEQSGVGANRMREVKGYDYQYPVSDNNTAIGRAQNRRVELYLMPSSQMIQEAQNASK